MDRIKHKLKRFLVVVSTGRIEDDGDTTASSSIHAIRALSFIGFSLIAIVASLSFGLVNLDGGEKLIGSIEVAFAVVVAFNLAWFLKAHNLVYSSAVVLFIVLVLLLILVIDGGISNTGVFWAFVFPISAYLLTNERVGTLWSTTLIGGVVLIGVLQFGGYLTAAYSTIELRQLVASLTVTTLVVLVYETAGAISRRTASKRSKDLLKTFARLQEEMNSRREAEENYRRIAEESKAKNENLERLKLAMTNLLEDIQEEKEKIEELSIRDEALLKSIGDGMIATDEYGKVVRFNKEVLTLLDINEKDIEGKGLLKVLEAYAPDGEELIDPEERAEMAALESGEIKKGKYLLKRADGTMFNASVTASPFIINDKPTGAVVTIRDITREAEVDKAKTEFVSLASHQLRTPLTAINWYIEMLESDEAESLTETQRDYLNEVYAANKRMVALVNALLNVSRVDLGTFMVDPTNIDLAEIAQTVIDELKGMIKQKKQKLTFKPDKKLKKLLADQKLMYIVFQNLISNAVKYTPEGGKIEVRIKQGKQWVTIEVEDNGYGIPKAQHNKIFTKLFRADNVVTKDTDGTGLGLYILKAIVEESEGTISFKSAEDKGTIFTVKLPADGMKKRKGSKGLSAEA